MASSLCLSKVRLLHLPRSFPVVGIRCTPPHNPFNPQSLISHLTNSNGCGNLIPGSVNVSPLGTLLLPQPRVYSQPSDFSGPSRNVSPAVSYSCRLFSSLSALFRARFLCFQQLADSFCKMPGVWGTSAIPRRALRLFTLLAPSFEGSLEGRVIILLCFCRPSSPRCFVDLLIPFPLRSLWLLSTFRINTCKSVSKQTTLTSFRINTYEKPRGGAPINPPSRSSRVRLSRENPPLPTRHSPLATPSFSQLHVLSCGARWRWA
jgi:hypothetical protein